MIMLPPPATCHPDQQSILMVFALGLALASAVFYGCADFTGGLATRRSAAIPVVLISQAAGLILVLLLLPVLPAATPSRADFAWGAAAGVAGGTGVALLYHALAIGVMSVVAPTTAVCAVIIPVVTSVALGERPAALTFVGMAVGIVAIVLVSLQASDADNTAARRETGLGVALCAGVAVGLFFYAIAQPRREAGVWPLVAARGVSVTLIGVLAAMRGSPLRMPRRILWLTIGCGALDMLANGVYMFAAQIGPLTPVVTLSSLYPATTVILASIVLHERLNAAQKVGVACALLAVILIVGSPRG